MELSGSILAKEIIITEDIIEDKEDDRSQANSENMENEVSRRLSTKSDTNNVKYGFDSIYSKSGLSHIHLLLDLDSL
jgi:hypothetical protein